MGLKRITTKDGEVYFVDAKTGQKVEVDARYTKTSQTPSLITINVNLSRSSTTMLRTLGFIIAAICIIIGGIVLGFSSKVSIEARPMILLTGISMMILGVITSVLYYVIAGIGDTVLTILKELKTSKDISNN